MSKIIAYVAAFGGTHVQAYEELIDMGEIRESDALLARCRKLDK